MDKGKQRRFKRVRRLITGSVLCAIILSVSTYAWFVGMKTVDVSGFDVEIAAIDGLSLSLNGAAWTNTVNISGSTYSTNSYTNNTNSWGGSGLKPMSSVGKIDTDDSRLILYEKGSFTTTFGGFRLMASQVTNMDGQAEQDGYVVFDLFVKNLSGNAYYPEMDQKNEEAIYLNIDSLVTVPDTGVQNTGIENSVRVAFAQIGRVKATDDTPSIVTAITCTTAGKVTGICADRDAQIWEPNDTKHVNNAIEWYKASCLKRIAEDIYDEDSYTTTCTNISDGAAYSTYAVSGVINYTDKVDIYDGAVYNTYTGSIASTATTGKLMSYKYFTDTMKNLSGTERPEFITLAPNSITKIRVYIWIEGQDIDNYDFASLGGKINVKFGFTKERYFDKDVKYDSTNTAQLPTDVVKDDQLPHNEDDEGTGEETTPPEETDEETGGETIPPEENPTPEDDGGA